MQKDSISAIAITSSLFGFALWIGFISWTSESSAYLFARLISTVFIILSATLLARTLWQRQKLQQSLALKKLAPALILLGLYIFIGAKLIGFYTSSYIIFLLLLSLYDSKGYRDVRIWFRRIAIGTAFMSVIYALFSLLLKVQTPVGWFI